MKVNVIGAGMAGLLAAGMLRGECASILEAQSNLPNNHSALLRFRSSIVGDTLNIPFKKVQVMKAVEGGLNPVAAALSYSMKTNGTARLRSITSAAGEIEERFIAPEDLVSQMAALSAGKFAFDRRFGMDDVNGFPGDKWISTIPMPFLMEALGWPGDKPDFLSVPGYTITAHLSKVDAYATVYIPDQLRQENRVSLTGSKLTIEVSLPHMADSDVKRRVDSLNRFGEDVYEIIAYAMKVLGLIPQHHTVERPEVKQQQYSKILPIDETIRRNFIVWASDNFGVYSLGRFATWRPGLLLDDVVNDVRVIQRLMKGQGAYDQRKKV